MRLMGWLAVIIFAMIIGEMFVRLPWWPIPALTILAWLSLAVISGVVWGRLIMRGKG
jgi:hypothetical protein